MAELELLLLPPQLLLLPPPLLPLVLLAWSSVLAEGAPLCSLEFPAEFLLTTEPSVKPSSDPEG